MDVKFIRIMDKLNEIKERLKNRKLDIVQMLAEDDSIYNPDVLIRLVWELRAIVKELKWLDE